jgi:hypothetical protein
VLWRGWRALWTAPTTWLGQLVARFAGCGPAEPIGGAATPAYLYRLPPGRLRGLGAIAFGHAIVVEPDFVARHFGAEREPWVIAHELSHTRQHDFLGPLYLPLHGLCMLFSTLMSWIRPVAGYPPQHAYNPLERSLLCVPFDVLVRPRLPSGEVAKRVFGAFGFSAPPRP